MADTSPQEVGIPIGKNNKLIRGTLITNKNGDAEWYQGTGNNQFAFPTFTSNKSNNYQWQPSPNCSGIFGDAACPTSEQRTNFYSNISSTNTLNNARLNTFNSAGGFNSPQLAKQLKIPGATNTAPTPPAPDQQGGSSGSGGTPPPAPDLNNPTLVSGQENNELSAAQLEIVPRGSRLQYPELMKTEQDKIKFTAVKVSERQGAGGTGLQSSFGTPIYTPVAGSVFLAIQSPISDQNSVDWGPDTVNAIDAAVFNASKGLIGTDKISTELTTLLKGFEEAARTNQTRLQNYFAGQAAGLNNVLARTDNVVLNPNLELLFQGPQLRPFSFTFKMSARSQTEADKIKKIIKYFKYHMAVRKEQGLFLRAPHVFTIQYMKGEEPQHPGINLISPTDDTKACALTNCSVDYTPLGTYATYEDGTMVAYTLSLQFQELTPIYDTDYTDAQSIGY
jgi:hypothetical protein